MTPTEQPKTGLVKFNQFLTHQKTNDYLAQVLGSKKESFVTNCVSLVSNNVNLQDCAPNSIMYSAIKATTLGLPLDNNLGFAYVLPYKNNAKGIQEAQFQMGYKGFIQLAMRSGQFKTINVTDVRENEILKIDRLTGEIDFSWLPAGEREKAEVVGYCAYFSLINGFSKSFFMTVDELKAHGKKYSKSYNSAHSNWKKLFGSMASKTVLKLLLSKYAPLSIEMADAIKYDQTVIRSSDEAQYIDRATEQIDITADNEAEQRTRILKFIEDAKTMDELDAVANSLDKKTLDEFSEDFTAREHQLLIEQS